MTLLDDVVAKIGLLSNEDRETVATLLNRTDSVRTKDLSEEEQMVVSSVVSVLRSHNLYCSEVMIHQSLKRGSTKERFTAFVEYASLISEENNLRLDYVSAFLVKLCITEISNQRSNGSKIRENLSTVLNMMSNIGHVVKKEFPEYDIKMFGFAILQAQRSQASVWKESGRNKKQLTAYRRLLR